MAAKSILEVVAEYANSGQTGTVMVVFADNSMGRFYFTAGVLATARYRSKEGDEALKLAIDQGINNVRLHENADLVRSAELIDPAIVSIPAGMPQVTTPAAQPTASVPPASQATAASGPALTHIARATIGDLLADYLGPVASVIMADIPMEASAEQALDLLSREISDTRMATRFVRDARRILQEM
ncbi:MAG: hypothetical protein KTR18_04305 [Acidiferrobacterales bacterium]|nr:hypothetical protein [Acidiferrobacterales bacterium]